MENEGEGTIEDMRYAYDENEAIIQEHNRVEVLIAAHTARAKIAQALAPAPAGGKP
jgi:hypothetical protein